MLQIEHPRMRKRIARNEVEISATISEASWFYCSLFQIVSNHVKDGMDGS